MATKNVVRHDIVQMDFLVEGLKDLTKLQKEIDDLKKKLTGGIGDDAFDDLKDSAEKSKKPIEKIKEQVEKTTKSVESLGKKAATTAFNGLKKMAGVSFKAATVGITAAATAIGGLVVKSVQAYADFEQLKGGVETLFGAQGAKTVEEYAKLTGKSVDEVKGKFKTLNESQDIVLKNANNAYKTAGLSANEYMETVTSFSASLLQSLDGDTKKAAKYADMAISDMADNANKMGTDMGSIQFAYQGFAKQNYTMLDNLKLGYGGTKGEMQRLIKDAAKIDKSVDANSLSYGNVVKAIHAMQVKMGIYGTTQKEAEKTITGSLNAMKASWGNLLTAISSGENLDQCIDNMVSAVETFGNNVVPVAEKALGGIGTLVEKLAPVISERLPSLTQKLLPPLIKAAVELTKGLIKALPDIIRTLFYTVADICGEQFPILRKIGDWFSDNADKIKKFIPVIAGLVGAFMAFNKIKGVLSIFGGGKGGSKGNKKGGFLGNLGETLKKLAKIKPKVLLKGMANLAIIVGGFAAMTAILLLIAPLITKLGDLKSFAKLAACMLVLGVVGTALAKFGEIAGKISVSTVAKGLANMAIMLAGMSVLLLLVGAVSLINFDYKKMLGVVSLIAVLGVVGFALTIFGGIAGLIPVSIVAMGLANIAIIIAGMSALFLLIGAVSLLDFNYKKMLAIAGIITVLGVIGATLAIFAGIVGLIPVAIVAMGLANIAIVIAGMSALFLLIGAVSLLDFNYMEMMKVVGMITVLGIVGSTLAIFAGIVGLIPIPVVLAGLANIALVLGGMTGLIVAFGALTQVQGFTEFLEKGGEVLVKIMNILGEMVGALAGGLIEGLSSCLPALGENLGKFGENIKPLFTSMAGVDMAGVGSFFAALVGLLGIATGNEIVQGIKSFFGGGDESSLSKLGTDLTSFATNSKGFFDTVATLPKNGFTNATNMFECLAGVKSLPKEGGVVGWFTGSISYASLADGLSQLASEKVVTFFNTVAELNETGFDMATKLFECLAGMKSLPKEGGVAGWFSGSIDYSKLASGLKSLSSEGVANFFAMAGGLSSKAFENVSALFKSLASISELPKEGGWWDKLTGQETTTLSNIATDLGDFAEKSGTFFAQVNELNIGNLNGLWNSLNNSKDVTAEVSRIVDENIDKIVKKITELPEKMGDGIKKSGKSLSEALVSIWTDAVKATVKPVNKLISGANWLLTEFGSKKRVTNWTPYAKGTDGHKGGNALVNDGRGAELVQMPNGNAFIPQGKNVFMPNAPKGMRVLSAEKTAQLMGRTSPTYRYENGTGNIDIWSYIDNAKGLINAVSKKYVDYNGITGLTASIARNMVSTVKGEMTSWTKKLFDEFGALSLAAYDPSKGVEQWRSTVIRALKMEGQYSAANVARTLYQMQTESGGNPRAINLWDSNAKKGIPSKGLMQVIDPTFKAYARAGFDKNIYDPLSNILASIRYAVSRYGSLANAYRGVGYANGGFANKPSIFGEDGLEAAIPLSKSKRSRGIDLWYQTGEMLGMSTYSPDDYTHSGNVENNTYAPVFNLTINGSVDDRNTERKVKKWIAEAMDEVFSSMSRSNPSLQEV